MYQYTPAQHKELQKKLIKTMKEKKKQKYIQFSFGAVRFSIVIFNFLPVIHKRHIVRFVRCEVFVLFSLVISFYGLEISFFLFVSLFILLLGGWLIVNILYKMCECIFLILLKEEERKLYKEGIT